MAEEEEELSFEEQLKLEELERRKRDGTLTKKDPDGTVYEWDDDKKAWFPKVCTTMKNKEMFFSWIIQQFLKVYNQSLKFQKKSENVIIHLYWQPRRKNEFGGKLT